VIHCHILDLDQPSNRFGQKAKRVGKVFLTAIASEQPPIKAHKRKRQTPAVLSSAPSRQCTNYFSGKHALRRFQL
jgi:hypothetical protein